VWFNRRHRRVGHLFQGRFKAILFEAEELAWGLSQYVHLNPVRLKRLRWDKVAQAQSRVGLGDGPTAAVLGGTGKRTARQRAFVTETEALVREGGRGGGVGTGVGWGVVGE
jgi:hypothetical protein